MLDHVDDLLRQPEYAELRRCSERTLERERSSGTGCPYVKIGRAVRYRRRDILEFIEKHLRQSTSENAPTSAVSNEIAQQERRSPEQGNRQPQQIGTARQRSAERGF